MEKSILTVIADNPALLEAVKNVLLREFSIDGMEEMMDDLMLGQMVRARLVGLRGVNEAFKKIARFKTTEEARPKVNTARWLLKLLSVIKKQWVYLTQKCPVWEIGT